MVPDRDAVIVTGASSGIGRSIAQTFADQGFPVVIGDIQKEPRLDGVPTHERIQRNGGNAIFVETDVRDHYDATALIDRAKNEYDGIELLVNNAGVAENGPTHEFPNDDWQNIMHVNLDGMFYCTKAALPHLLDQDTGQIINISSGAGKTGIPKLAAYCTSKFGVIGFTESIAKEYEPNGIRANAVCPGRTKTAMTSKEGVPPQRVADTVMDVYKADYTGRAVDVT